MSDERTEDQAPRRPDAGSAWRWLQIAGLLLMCVVIVPAALLSVSRTHDPSPWSLGRFDRRLVEMVYVVVVPTLVLVGAALALRPRRLVARPALLAALASMGVAAVMLTFHAATHTTWEGDATLFVRMADEWPWRPGGWFRYRLVAPWIAKTLGGDGAGRTGSWLVDGGAARGYFLLALFSVAATGPALSLLLRDLKFGTAARHLGVLLYLCSFATLYNTWNYAMPDPLAMLVLVLACRAIVRGRDWELAVWLLLGGLTKEVVLFVVPVRWLWARREGLDIPQALRAGLVALPALAVFAWLRFRPDEVAEYTGFVTGNAWLYPWREQPDNVARLYSPFAAGWALIALSLRRPDRWTLAAIGFAIPCVLSLLVTDAGRMLVYLTPFAIPAILRAAGAGERVSRRGLIAVLLVCLSMRLWEPFAPLWKVPEMVRRPLALLLIPVCIWLVVSRGRETE